MLIELEQELLVWWCINRWLCDVVVPLCACVCVVPAVQAGGDGYQTGGQSSPGEGGGQVPAGGSAGRRVSLLHGQTLRHGRVLHGEGPSTRTN